MATLGSPSTSNSPRQGRKKWARKCERCCCSTIIYLPLLFVYGLTTWAIWVVISIGKSSARSHFTGSSSNLLGIALYILLNWSYTTAVFTDPGSSSRPFGSYDTLPTREPPTGASALTAKYNGEVRYCKKCQARKPDRAHHCSTCRRCVLQMDHHCPWLATCIGLRNRKAFVLFLVYTSLFCLVCCGVSATWVWTEVLSDGHFEETMMPVNYILLTVVAGIFGLVLTGFTTWHIWLVFSGQTTIESLEKTRYLSPLRNAMKNQQLGQHDGQTIGQQLREIHANAIPGVTRQEEGEERSSPAHDSLRRNFQADEYMRERQRYDDYLDEQDSEKLPNAFDLGYRQNFKQVFGPKALLWAFPICNSEGDGWRWETSVRWHEARSLIFSEREAQVKAREVWEREYGVSNTMGPGRNVVGNQYPQAVRYPVGSQMPMETLETRRQPSDGLDYDSSSDDDDEHRLEERRQFLKQKPATGGTTNWNDPPEEFLAPSSGRSANQSRPSSRQ